LAREYLSSCDGRCRHGVVRLRTLSTRVPTPTITTGAPQARWKESTMTRFIRLHHRTTQEVVLVNPDHVVEAQTTVYGHEQYTRLALSTGEDLRVTESLEEVAAMLDSAPHP
jgi:hypothetical protein